MGYSTASAAMPAGRRPKVVFTDGSIHPTVAERLRETCALHILRAYPSEDVLTDACRDAEAIPARLGVVTARVIAAAPRLRIIARHGAGSDGVDLAAATARGIVVTTTGPTNAGAVAEYTFALLLALLRRVPDADAGMRAGAWSRTPFAMPALAGMAGSSPAMTCWVTGRRTSIFPPSGMTPETHGMIDVRAIATMRPGAVLVNTARGELVDEAALIAALQTGHLAGAARDTYAVEPLAVRSPLRRMANVVLSPHVAGQTKDALLNVGLAAARAILDELAGRRPRFVVNPAAYAARS
jgi:D-3-phosphoglycerate dehydrogenase